jgi:hypothetical protein
MSVVEGSDDRPTVAAQAARTRAMIDANAYMTIASADAVGVPWASPVWFAHHQYTEFLWVSRPDARHSNNITARAEVGIVIFDSTVPEGSGDAVYLEGIAREAGEAERSRMLVVLSTRSTNRGGAAWSAADVTGDAPHRLYIARAVAHFVLDDHDRRVPVTIDG